MRFVNSTTVNSIIRAIGFNPNDKVTQDLLANTIQSLLDAGNDAQQVTNILRPTVPAFKSLVGSLNGFY